MLVSEPRIATKTQPVALSVAVSANTEIRPNYNSYLVIVQPPVSAVARDESLCVYECVVRKGVV